MNAESCPIDGTKVNEPVVRIVAILSAMLAIIGTILSIPLIYLILVYDFFVRGFINRKYSLLRIVAKQINHLLGFKKNWINGAPKKFAAKVGFIFSVTIFALLLLQYTIAAYIVTGILLICALLEGIMGYCVGCEVYYLLQKFGFIKYKDEEVNDLASL